MSWQNYVDQQLIGSGLIAKAVIAGHDGTLWAKSSNIEPTKDELERLSSNFQNQENLFMTGVTIAGDKYFYLSGTDKVIRCKKGKAGMHCMKTVQAILVATFEDPVQHPQVAQVVEALGDYLISMNY